MLLGGFPLLARAPKPSHAASSLQDTRILNFALLVEYLEDAFYRAALDGGALTGELLEFAEEVGRHERAHVGLLRETLGADADPSPAFDFGDAVTDPQRFGRAALILERTGMSAYIGQGANLTRRAVVTAGRIASVEARHTAWISNILGRHPAPHAADPAMTRDEVVTTLRDTGFFG